MQTIKHEMNSLSELETAVRLTPDLDVQFDVVSNDEKSDKLAQDWADNVLSLLRKYFGAKPVTIHPHLMYPFKVRIFQASPHDFSSAQLDFYIYNQKVENFYDYYCTVLGMGPSDKPSEEWGWNLEEQMYPNHSAKFSVEQTLPYDSEYQINIFGHFKHLSSAFRSLKLHGNSTYNNRKPKEIYV